MVKCKGNEARCHNKDAIYGDYECIFSLYSCLLFKDYCMIPSLKSRCENVHLSGVVQPHPLATRPTPPSAWVPTPTPIPIPKVWMNLSPRGTFVWFCDQSGVGAVSRHVPKMVMAVIGRWCVWEQVWLLCVGLVMAVIGRWCVWEQLWPLCVGLVMAVVG